MSKRESQLDKAIKDLDYQLAVLEHARETLVKQRDKADLAAARPPTLKTVSK